MPDRWQDLDEQAFGDLLDRYLHPSSPIRQEESLRGREPQLQTIREALASSGRNVFVYGDRGVGKTSLALTSAHIYQSSDQNPVLVACDRDATFYSVVRDVVAKLLGQIPIRERRTTTKQLGAQFGGLSAQHVTAIEQGNVEAPTSVNEAVALLQFAGAAHSRRSIAIIDEFEALADARHRALFGDLLKQIGDQGVELKLIFSGVGHSLDEMLAQHGSAYRYVASVCLERLGQTPLIELMEEVSREIEIPISRNRLFRIAAISDGFPHYVHLLGTKFFWRYYRARSESESWKNEARLFDKALADAVGEVDAQLRASYDRAVEKYRDGEHYEYILWALASYHLLKRKTADVFTSYEGIARKMRVEPINRQQYDARMNRLKREEYGAIVIGTRQGWYQFREPIMRGYCRLQAQLRGLELGVDYPFN